MKSLLLFGFIILSGCSLTLSVRGQVQKSTETFTGTATGYMGGGGDLKLVSSQGSTCSGNFVYVTPRNGEGVFHCTDGRSGPFRFVSTGNRGTGYGELDGEKVIFIFGD